MNVQTSMAAKFLEGRMARALEGPLILWCLAAVGLFTGLDTLIAPGHIAGAFSDSDDATRLVQVRELMAGAPWFDTTLPRIGAPDALVSHWSRLIDLPIALLIFLFGLVLSPAHAELAARIVWPLGLFTALLWVMARGAEARAGRKGALIALLLGILCFSGTTQFVPGRIDHHNVLILAAVSGVLLLAASFKDPKAGWFAGGALGLGAAIGYEALPLIVVSLASAGLIAAVTGRGREGVARAALAFAATLGAAFLLTIAPERWSEVRCDALSANLAVLAAFASGGLAAALYLAGPPWLRFGVIGIAGTAGLTFYGVLEPACLGGPFAQVAPAVRPIWLDHVSETQGLIWLVRVLPAAAFAFVLHVGAGLGAALIVARKDRHDGALFYAAVLAAAAVFSLIQAKLMPYAAFLAVPPLAIAIARLKGSQAVSAGIRRAVAVAGLNQQTALVLGALLFGAGQATYVKDIEARRACLTAEAIAPLAALPEGLVVTEPDLGPFIVALTEHSVLAAPYHRLDKAILETHALFFASAGEAYRRLIQLNASYVVVCPGLSSTNFQGVPPADAMKPALLRGQPPDFLARVPLASKTPLEVWRVKAGVLNPRP